MERKPRTIPRSLKQGQSYKTPWPVGEIRYERTNKGKASLVVTEWEGDGRESYELPDSIRAEVRKILHERGFAGYGDI